MKAEREGIPGLMEEARKPIERQTGLRPMQHAVAFLLACAVVVSRRPDALFHPQFWAEDGIVWFAQAYNGTWWRALFRTEVGYFQTLSRLGAALALLVPLACAPLVMNLIALAAQALPVNLLLSHRARDWGSLRRRLAFAAIYIALPNCPEICANITNAQWVLAFSAFLILVASPATTTSGRIFDIIVLLLCGLTGPFCFFLLPVAMFKEWKNRDRQYWVPIGILTISSLIQAYGLLVLGTTQRSSANLGATPVLFIRILAGHVYIGGLFGPSSAATAQGARSFVILFIVALLGTALITFALRRAPLPMKVFAAFAMVILAAELISPSSYDAFNTPKWQLIAGASAIRYWFFPSLLFLWSVVIGLERGPQPLKAASALVLVLLIFGVALRWRRPAYEDTHFPELAHNFESAPVGTRQVFPENPEGWSFQLVKHGRK